MKVKSKSNTHPREKATLKKPSLVSVNMTSASWDMESHTISSLYENTNSKSSLAVILRGQPTFYDQRLVRYEFWEILEPKCSPKYESWSPSKSWK